MVSESTEHTTPGYTSEGKALKAAMKGKFPNKAFSKIKIGNCSSNWLALSIEVWYWCSYTFKKYFDDERKKDADHVEDDDCQKRPKGWFWKKFKYWNQLLNWKEMIDCV